MSAPSWVEVNGVALRYELSGAGPLTLVFVHELGGSLNSWDRLLHLLPRETRVLRYDMRGAGLSEKTPGAVRLDDMGDDLDALARVLGLAEPFTVLGAAVGGAIAARFAGRFPHLCRRLVLIGPALGVPAERRSAALAITDRVDAAGMRAIAADVLPKAFPDALWEDPADKTVVQARWLGADPQGYAATYRMLINSDVRGALPDITCPVLALAGRHDPFGTPQILESATAVIPNVRFAVIEGGHFMHVQSPTRVAEAIIPFLTDA